MSFFPNLYFRVSVREACIHGLLHTAAGQSLLTIAATGVDTIEQRMLESGR